MLENILCFTFFLGSKYTDLIWFDLICLRRSHILHHICFISFQIHAAWRLLAEVPVQNARDLAAVLRICHDDLALWIAWHKRHSKEVTGIFHLLAMSSATLVPVCSSQYVPACSMVGSMVANVLSMLQRRNITLCSFETISNSKMWILSLKGIWNQPTTLGRQLEKHHQKREPPHSSAESPEHIIGYSNGFISSNTVPTAPDWQCRFISVHYSHYSWRL